MAGAEFRAAVREIFVGIADQLAEAATRDEGWPLAETAVRRWAGRPAPGHGLVAPETQVRLTRAVLDERFGLGPLQPLIDDDDVEQVDINGPGQVWLQLRGGRKVAAPPIAATNAELEELVRGWGQRDGQTAREFSDHRPTMNAALATGVRLTAVMSVTRQVHVSVRVHRLVDITLEDLTGPPRHTLTPVLADFLRALVRARRNIIVTGGMGAGKTTLLRALSAAIGEDERIATLETDYELYLDQMPGRHHDVVALEAREPNSEGAGAISLHDLIPVALRLNARRIIVGEARDTEVLPMLEAMNSGQEGSMTSIHANSAEEVFSRILMLSQRGGLPIPPTEVYLAVGLSRPFVVHLRTDQATGERYAAEVLEVMPPGDGIQPARNRVFAPGSDGRAEYCRSLSDETAGQLSDAGFDAAMLTWGRP